MKTQEEKDERRAAEYLQTEEGKWFHEWLKGFTGVEKPVFVFDDQGRTNTLEAAMREGQRAVYGKLTNLIIKYTGNDE